MGGNLITLISVKLASCLQAANTESQTSTTTMEVFSQYLLSLLSLLPLRYYLMIIVVESRSPFLIPASSVFTFPSLFSLFSRQPVDVVGDNKPAPCRATKLH